MIHSLTTKNGVKHHNRTFTFQEGVNLIRGDNEGGKSLILEFIDFALHGSVALRLPVSMYPANLQVELEVTIRGERFSILRTPKKASISKDGCLIASGTKPVDAEIRKLLGYNRNVFLVSNYSSQDAIQYLSSMKPAERKRTIDNVVGLTAVEQVIAEHKTNLTVLNREMDSVKRREVIKPVEPEVTFIPHFAEKIEELKVKISRESSVISVQESLIKHHESLDKTKPEFRAELPTSGLIEGLTEQAIATREVQIYNLTNKVNDLSERYKTLRENSIEKPIEPSREGYIKGVNLEKIHAKRAEKSALEYSVNHFSTMLKDFPDVNQLVKYSQEEINAIEEQWKLFHDWEHVQKHKQKGSVTCNHCDGEVFLAVDYIKNHYSHVPDFVEKPQQNHGDMDFHNKEIDAILSQSEGCKVELDKAQKSLDEFNQNWHSEEDIQRHILVEEALYEFRNKNDEWHSWAEKELNCNQSLVEARSDLDNLTKDWHTNIQLAEHRVALHNQVENLRNKQLVEQWQKSKDSLTPVDLEALEAAKYGLPISQVALAQAENAQHLWSTYNKEIDLYENWNREKEDALCEVELEKERINALNIFKAKIKTTILPSVNAVASTWMRRMSEGKHQKVELTDNMEILVNGEPIEALSISGRALGHLSLRMALGQVLTNAVFPVFMADEVDASMRNNRAQNVLDSLTDMLKGSMKQIIMISHQNLEAVDNIIEV